MEVLLRAAHLEELEEWAEERRIALAEAADYRTVVVAIPPMKKS